MIAMLDVQHLFCRSRQRPRASADTPEAATLILAMATVSLTLPEVRATLVAPTLARKAREVTVQVGDSVCFFCCLSATTPQPGRAWGACTTKVALQSPVVASFTAVAVAS